MRNLLCVKIPPWIRTTSKTLLLVLLICFCGVINVSCDGSGKGDGIVESDAVNAKIEYLNKRIKELENSIVRLKSDAYVSEATYQTKINILEKEIERLKKEAESVVSDSETVYEPSTVPTNATQTPRPGITLTFSVENGKATITGYSGIGETLVIPSTIGGYKVEKIADEAFARTAFTNIVIEDGVSYIGWFAFSENTALRSITVPKSVKKAEYGVFNGCTGKLTVYTESDSYMAVYAKSYGITTENIG